VFLCAFLHNFEATQEILHKSGKLQEVMNLFLNETTVFEDTPYDKKVSRII